MSNLVTTTKFLTQVFEDYDKMIQEEIASRLGIEPSKLQLYKPYKYIVKEYEFLDRIPDEKKFYLDLIFRVDDHIISVTACYYRFVDYLVIEVNKRDYKEGLATVLSARLYAK